MTDRHPAIPYVAPFLAFVAFMAIEKLLPLPSHFLYIARFTVVLAIILFVSRPLVSFWARSPFGSIAVGVGVFAIWVAPDILWPGYRQHWLFENSLTGAAQSTLPPGARVDPLFIAIRIAGSTLLVPILEELFWRGWLMRWLIHRDFRKVPLGAWSASSFWIVALLFASEHGPYWEVGLLAGVVYNWWIVRTKSLADCIVAHAVTNGVLSVYVLATGQWQYWL